MAGYKVLPIPPLPNTQALSSTTFRPPPLDGSLTLPEIYDWHLRKNPNHPLFVYPDAPGSVRAITWREAVQAFHRAGRIVRDEVISPSNVEGEKPLVGILATSDTIPYTTILGGIVRAGYAAFPIYPRNSPAAVAHLIKKAGITHVLVGREQVTQDILTEALNSITDESVKKPSVYPLPTFERLYVDEDDAHFEPLPLRRPHMDETYITLHSSGSTSFPKPITWTHYKILLLLTVGFYSETDLTGLRLANHATPVYHMMGIFIFSLATSCGWTLSAFRPQIPPAVPTPDTVFEGALETKGDIILCVPSFLEAWSRDPLKVEHLKKLSGVMFGGGPLNAEAGSTLLKAGVNVFILYGSTEMGVPHMLFDKNLGGDYNYFRLAGHSTPEWVPDGNGAYELVLLSNPRYVPAVFNTEISGVGGYATSDLMAPHPTREGYWRVVGRADDQIAHSTGEKTNPGPLESILNQDPHIQAAVMFGRGRFQPGVIIDPKDKFKFDPADTEKLVEFRNKIWPSVERMNAFAPQHSRVFKEMILVANPAKPFTYTAKRTARRQAIINEYEPEIDALYVAVDETVQADIPLPETWSSTGALGYVRKLISQVLTQQIEDEEDIFARGCDSLQATWIRNSLLHVLRESAKVDTRQVSPNVVYDYPTVASLATYISEVVSGGATVDSVDGAKRRIEDMVQMVKKYTAGFSEHIPILSAPSGDGILVTGTTGGIGANVLAYLINAPEVTRVFALNRPRTGGQNLKERQTAAFESRDLDASLLESPKLTLLEADFDKPDLGLTVNALEEIRSTLTHIIHIAWQVDFNKSLRTFEPTVRGVRYLIDLALSSHLPSPPRFVFTSSVAVVRNVANEGKVREAFYGPQVASGTGYSESKWVSEEILSVASEKTPVETVVVRVGQVSGGTDGAWNISEWVPSLVASSIYLNALPIQDQSISWIPLDVTARTVLEMRHSRTKMLHLVHPRPVPWSAVFRPIAAMLHLPTVTYNEWLSLIEESGKALENLKGTANATAFKQALDKNPALKIIDFFRTAQEESQNPGTEAIGLRTLDVSEAVKASKTLAEARELGETDARRWIGYWARAGLIAPQVANGYANGYVNGSARFECICYRLLHPLSERWRPFLEDIALTT